VTDKDKTKSILEKITPDECMFLLQKGAASINEHTAPSSKTLDIIADFRKDFTNHVITEDATDKETHKKLDKVIFHFEDKQGLINRIDAQVQRTNGRVTKLENWKTWTLGGIAFVSVVLPLLAYFYVVSEEYKMDLKIKTALELKEKDARLINSLNKN
jgi:hypothetical protein